MTELFRIRFATCNNEVFSNVNIDDIIMYPHNSNNGLFIGGTNSNHIAIKNNITKVIGDLQIIGNIFDSNNNIYSAGGGDGDFFLDSNSILNHHIANSNITVSKLETVTGGGDYVVTSYKPTVICPKIGAGIELVPGEIDNSNILIGNEYITDKSITTRTIDDSAVTTDKIADYAVSNIKLGEASISRSKFQDSCIFSSAISDNAIISRTIQNNAVVTSKIPDQAITTEKIKLKGVTTDILDTDAVTTIKILDENVTNRKLADYCVTTDKIFESNITTDKAYRVTGTGDAFVLPNSPELTGNILVKHDSNIELSDTISSYPFIINKPAGAADDETGVCFVIGGVSDTRTPGASITYERVGANDFKGNLRFNVQSASSTTGPLINAMFIRHDGNVGIGTNTPTAKLDVNGGDIKTSGSVLTGELKSFNTDNKNLHYFGDDHAFYTQARGDIGVVKQNEIALYGTSAANKHIWVTQESSSVHDASHVGSTFIGSIHKETNSTWFVGMECRVTSDTANAPTTDLDKAANQGHIIFNTWGNGTGTVHEKMRIRSDGNVGIGTTTPTEKLDVNGTALMQSGLPLRLISTGNNTTECAVHIGGSTGPTYIASFNRDDPPGNKFLPGVGDASKMRDLKICARNLTFNEAGGCGSVYLNRLANTHWITSFDGKQRLHFGNNSHTYIKSPDSVIIRTNNSDAAANEFHFDGSTISKPAGSLHINAEYNMIFNIDTNANNASLFYWRANGTTANLMTLNESGHLSANRFYVDSDRALSEVTGQYGTVQTVGGKNWGGYSIAGQYVFMASGNTCGIYNDINNEWMIQCIQNGATTLYYNGANKLSTTNTGVVVTGNTSASQYYLSQHGRGLTNVTGNYGSVQTIGTGAGNWNGYSINGQYVFMGKSDSSECGIYNDIDNRWKIRCIRTGATSLFHGTDTNAKLITTSTGINVPGTLAANTIDFPESTSDKILLYGSGYKFAITSSSLDYHTGGQHAFKVSDGTNRLIINNAGISVSGKIDFPDTTDDKLLLHGTSYKIGISSSSLDYTTGNLAKHTFKMSTAIKHVIGHGYTYWDDWANTGNNGNNVYNWGTASHRSSSSRTPDGAMCLTQGGNLKIKGSYTPSSDDRVKSDEVFITNALATVIKIRPQEYQKWNTINYASDSNAVSQKESGVIAQELYIDAPELRHLVTLPEGSDSNAIATTASNYSTYDDLQNDPHWPEWSGGGSNNENIAYVNYTGLIPYTIQAIKELHVMVKDLQKENQELRNLISSASNS